MKAAVPFWQAGLPRVEVSMTTDDYAYEGREVSGHGDPGGADRDTPSPAPRQRHVTNPLQTWTTLPVVVCLDRKAARSS